jgi:hypothetical protein
MSRTPVSLALVAALGLTALPATAGPFGPTPYLSAADSPFGALSFSYFHRETFEDSLFNVPGVSKSAGLVIGAGSGLTDSVDADDGAINGSGLAGHSLFAVPGATGILFSFDAAALGQLPSHAGIVWTDGLGLVTLTAFGPGMIQLGAVSGNFADNSISGTTAEDRFLGWSDPAGILAFRIQNASGGIEVDHLQYGRAIVAPVQAVPEPASLALLASGVALLLRRRPRQLR